jgi:phosphopentomutase
VRALLLVLDSVGVGGAPDAEGYGDAGANTLGHIFERMPELCLPHLDSLGLGKILTGRAEARPSRGAGRLRASYGRMRERSAGKDTTTGHWELAGVILEEPFPTFARFPDALVRQIEQAASVQFIGNCARSGTEILRELGPEHLRTGHPILYTSADSVMQIAAHEEVVAVERLYEICAQARQAADAYRIGRVIARPFTGAAGNFRRTSRRHDFSLPPPHTVLDEIPTIGIGKIGDIFAGRGIDRTFPTTSNRDGMERIAELWETETEGLLFANLVDFDMLYGHRRDVAGYGNALREFDDWLGDFLPRILANDLVIVTADHGNDPTFRGTDHTREEVPLFVLHGEEARDLRTRETFADVAATLAEFFRLPGGWTVGRSFIQSL